MLVHLDNLRRHALAKTLGAIIGQRVKLMLIDNCFLGVTPLVRVIFCK